MRPSPLGRRSGYNDRKRRTARRSLWPAFRHSLLTNVLTSQAPLSTRTAPSAGEPRPQAPARPVSRTACGSVGVRAECSVARIGVERRPPVEAPTARTPGQRLHIWTLPQRLATVTGMDVRFIASVSVIVTDPSAAHRLFLDALGLALSGPEGDDYLFYRGAPRCEAFRGMAAGPSCTIMFWRHRVAEQSPDAAGERGVRC